MGVKVGKLLKDPKIIVIVLLIVVALSLIAFIPLGESIKPFKIQDKCGRFVNVESHTIPDEETCTSRCRSQCASKDHTFKKIEFTETQGSCHTCMCHCK